MATLKNLFALILVCSFLVGCASRKPASRFPSLFDLASQKKAQVESPKEPKPKTKTEELAEKEGASLEEKTSKKAPKPPKEPSSIQEISFLKASSLKGKEIPVEIDLEGADLLEFLELTFKNTLGLNYVVSSRARAKITAYIRGQFSPEAFYRLISQVLEIEGISLLREGNLVRVIPKRELARFGKGYELLILKPRYLSSNSLHQIIRTFTSQEGTVYVDRQRGLALVVDASENLKKIKRLVTLLDEDFLASLYFEVYKPRVLSAEDLANYLQKIFRSQILRTFKPDQYVDFIPVKELDVLLILARHPENAWQIKRWLAELDTGEIVEEQLFVYPVENGDAKEIAEILQQAFSERTTSKRETIVRAQKGKSKPRPSKTGFISGKVKIIPDPTNNLLVIRASREDYEIIEGILRQLDVMPRQVLIEVLIAEVTLDRALEYGVEWFIKTELHHNGREYPGVIGLSHKGAAPAVSGEEDIFSLVLRRKGEVRFLLEALDRVSEVNILSSPVLLATNGKESMIQVGQEVPFVSREVANTAAETPNITRSIQYRDTGIILKVKPYINSSGLVKLEIEQEVSAAQSNPLGLDSPLFSKRKVQTSLVVKDQQTVILGGLISSQNERAEVGVPILKDIPLLGNAFKWNTRGGKRTELLIAITPKVVRNLTEAEEAMKDFKERIRQLKEKLEKS